MQTAKMLFFPAQVSDKVAAIVPGVQMRLNDLEDSSTWEIIFPEGTSKKQMDAAYALLPSITFEEPKPAPKVDDALALLVAKGVITQKDVDEIPVKPIISTDGVINVRS